MIPCWARKYSSRRRGNSVVDRAVARTAVNGEHHGISFIRLEIGGQEPGGRQLQTVGGRDLKDLHPAQGGLFQGRSGAFAQAAQRPAVAAAELEQWRLAQGRKAVEKIGTRAGKGHAVGAVQAGQPLRSGPVERHPVEVGAGRIFPVGGDEGQPFFSVHEFDLVHRPFAGGDHFFGAGCHEVEVIPAVLAAEQQEAPVGQGAKIGGSQEIHPGLLLFPVDPAQLFVRRRIFIDLQIVLAPVQPLQIEAFCRPRPNPEKPGNGLFPPGRRSSQSAGRPRRPRLF